MPQVYAEKLVGLGGISDSIASLSVKLVDLAILIVTDKSQHKTSELSAMSWYKLIPKLFR